LVIAIAMVAIAMMISRAVKTVKRLGAPNRSSRK
jgi:hypothetical protein